MDHENSDLWQRLQAMCIAINPTQPNGGLLPAADSAQIAETERALGISFPQDLRDAYRHFNGMVTWGEFKLFPGYFRWLPLAEDSQNNWMYSKWKTMCHCGDQTRANPDLAELEDEVDRVVVEGGEPVYRKFADRTRIPVAFDSTVQMLFVDTQPPPAGRKGQLIYSAPDEPDITRVLAGSFTEAVEKLVSAYEAGRITFEYSPASTWVWAGTGQDVDLGEL